MMLDPRHAAWIAAMKAAGRGGLKAADNIVRGETWSTVIRVAADWSGDTITASLGYEPDDGVSEANDLSVNVGSYSGITLQLSSGSTATLEDDADGDGLVSVLFDLHRTPSGGSKYLAFGGWTYITGSVGNV